MIFAAKVKYYNPDEIVFLPHLPNVRIRQITHEAAQKLLTDEDYLLTFLDELSNEHYRVYRDKGGNHFFVKEEEEFE